MRDQLRIERGACVERVNSAIALYICYLSGQVVHKCSCVIRWRNIPKITLSVTNQRWMRTCKAKSLPNLNIIASLMLQLHKVY